CARIRGYPYWYFDVW
nr:immunoglobulin heavy chain junction region [Mus musculus]